MNTIEATGENQRYATMSDVCGAIADALGAYADEHDIEAIADEAFGWYRAYDPEANVEYLHEQGYYQTVTADEFWAICAHHTRWHKEEGPDPARGRGLPPHQETHHAPRRRRRHNHSRSPRARLPAHR